MSDDLDIMALVDKHILRTYTDRHSVVRCVTCTQPLALYEHAHFMQWVRYYVMAEEYDRTLPGGWSPHDSNMWLPHPSVKAQSSRHATERIRRMDPEARKDQKAKRRALDFTAQHHTREADFLEVIRMASRQGPKETP